MTHNRIFLRTKPHGIRLCALHGGQQEQAPWTTNYLYHLAKGKATSSNRWDLKKFSPEKEKWLAQEWELKACRVLNQMAVLLDFGPAPVTLTKKWNFIVIKKIPETKYERQKFNFPTHSGFFYKHKFQLNLSIICSENISFMINYGIIIVNLVGLLCDILFYIFYIQNVLFSHYIRPF